MRNPKSQTPNLKQIPSSKSQGSVGIRSAARTQYSCVGPLRLWRNTSWILGFGIFLGLVIWDLEFSSAFAQGTTFTYQGRLNGDSTPANGNYDLTFQLFDAAAGGSSQGGPITNNNINVTAGLFTVALDFGPGPFGGGAARWLEIGVRTNGGSGFTTLTPRQLLTPSPFAIFAANAAS